MKYVSSITEHAWIVIPSGVVTCGLTAILADILSYDYADGGMTR